MIALAFADERLVSGRGITDMDLNEVEHTMERER